MPNMTVSNASSAVQMQTQAPQGGNTDQVAEAFGNVLARQRANQEGADASQVAIAEEAMAAADDAASLQDVKEVKQGIADLMLAEFLPKADHASAVPTKEEDGLKASAGGEVSTLPGSMPPALTPAISIQQGVAVKNAGGEGKGVQPALPPLADAKNSVAVKPSDVGTGDSLNEVFQAPLETFSKNSVNSAQLLESTQTPLQPTQNSTFALTGLAQNGTAALASGTSIAAQSQLSTPLASNAWSGEFSQKIVWMATQREQTAELHLNPPNLGPLDVVISVSDDQATALFTSQHAAVRNAVEQALPILRQMLADNGITLGNAMVSDQPSRERQAAHDSNRQQGTNLPDATSEAASTSGSRESLLAWPGRRREGMVDTFA